MKPDLTPQETRERVPYEAPAIVYEGELTTRAGTPIPVQGPDSGVDPADLFGNVE